MRTLVAVGTPRLASMLATMREAAPAGRWPPRSDPAGRTAPAAVRWPAARRLAAAGGGGRLAPWRRRRAWRLGWGAGTGAGR